MNTESGRRGFRRWFAAAAATLVLVATPAILSAQLIGDPVHDTALVDFALADTLAATASGAPKQSRVTMEELYRVWRIFRRMDFAALPDGASFVSDMEAVEARLWAASKLVDDGKLSEAHAELETARELLSAARTRHGLIAAPKK